MTLATACQTVELVAYDQTGIALRCHSPNGQGLASVREDRGPRHRTGANRGAVTVLIQSTDSRRAVKVGFNR